MSDRDGVHRFVVCEVVGAAEGESAFDVRTVFGGESFEEVVDEVSGEKCTVFRQNGEVVDTAGELCGVFDDRGEARIHASRLNKVRDVMDS